MSWEHGGCRGLRSLGDLCIAVNSQDTVRQGAFLVHWSVAFPCVLRLAPQTRSTSCTVLAVV